MNANKEIFPDKNLHVDTIIEKDGLKFIEVRNAPFEVYGLYDYKNQSEYKRLPDDIGLNVNEGVSSLYLHTAGGRVRFSTDSRYIAIKVEMKKVSPYPHMPLTNTAGLDLYIDAAEGEELGFFKTFVPPYNMTNGYESKIDLGVKKMRSFTINMPSYNCLTKLYVGVDSDAFLDKGQEYRPILPVVYYGSSITQGGCASRPGNIYQNIISRRLNIDYINLGFSGSGKAEPIIAEYMAGLPMSVFVSDYDHNAPTVEYLENTHFALYKTIREKNPTLPYVMVTRPDYRNKSDSEARRQVILKSYHDALALGDKNVYFVDGKEFFTGKYADMCTVDSTHPTDLGFSFMADHIGATLEKILGSK
jgi:hypothetical protein